MYRGDPSEWESRLESFAALTHKTKIYVPGNHDYYPYHYRGIARSTLRREGGRTVLNDGADGVTKLGDTGLTMLAIPYVTGLQGWAYNVEEEWLDDWLRRVYAAFYTTPDIVVSHSPPWRILDSTTTYERKEHYGSTAMNKWFHSLERKPKLWVCGHIHDSYGVEVIDGCTFANVAMCNEQYKQVNPAMVFDL